MRIEGRIRTLFIFLLALNVLTVSIILRTRSYPAPNADYQTIIKLSVWTVSAIFSLLCYKVWLHKLFRFDNIFMSIFVLICCFSTFYAPLFYFSAATAYTVICTYILCYTATNILEDKDCFNSVYIAFSIVCIISIIIYFAVPEFGRFKEWQGSEQIIGTRMQGITGTANALGFISAFAVLTGLHIKKHHYMTNHFWFWLFFILNCFTLIMTNSRTSIGALIIALLITSLYRATYKKLALYCIAIAGALLLLLCADIDSLLRMISRSGDASEITSGTGRTDIWKVTLDLIQKQLFLGYGFSSSLQIFDQYQDDVGYKVASAHNMILQILLTTGLLGGVFFIMAYLVKGYTALKNGNTFIVSGLIFIFIIGISEATAVQGTANASTLALFFLFAIQYKSQSKY